MIVVHHLNDSRSQRVLRLLDETGLPYEAGPCACDPGTPPAPRAGSLAAMSVIDNGRLSLAGSSAILSNVVGRSLHAGRARRPAACRVAVARDRYPDESSARAARPAAGGAVVSAGPEGAPARGGSF